MKKILIILVVLFSPILVSAKTDFQKGMSYPAYNKKVLSSAKSDLRLKQLSKTGTEYVAIIPVWYQKTKKSTKIYQASWSATDKSVIHGINRIHSLGMKVMLKPYVDSLDDVWRAEFKPRNFDKWWESYRDFMLHYAQMAADNDVEQLSLGVEYNFAEKYTEQWQQLIADIREIYDGELTYSANFIPTDNGAGGYRQIDFWDDLDYVGIDAYFPLTDNNYEPTRKQLRKGWNQWIKQIEKWRAKKNITKPIIFTEIGYSSYDGVNTEPWGYWYDDKKEDQKEQADCYRAFFKKVYPKDWMAGAYWWYWDNPSTNSSEDPYYLNFTTRGKKAVKVLKKYY